jgi:hypothetical protein
MSVALYKRGSDEKLWDFSVSHDEIVAGCYAASFNIMAQLENHYEMKIAFNKNKLNAFMVAKNVPLAKTRSKFFYEKISKQYAVWVISDNIGLYNLWQFDNDKWFFQGLITICDNFAVVAEEFVLGKIFNKFGEKYILPNFAMIPHKYDEQFGNIIDDSDDIDDPNVYAPFTDDIDAGLDVSYDL